MKLPVLSGKEVVKVLCNHFGFKIINGRGSHLILMNESHRPPTLLTVVLHKELRTGTLQQIIAGSGVDREAFLEAVNC
jgi:predicted RNA binding protein YcfA (HicA-like mRNA interferase family)